MNLFYLNTKKTWEGQFQIVLSSKKKVPSKEDLTSIKLLNLGSSNEIRTQVGILESPSILMPIFNFVKTEKNKASSKYMDLDYYEWKETLQIKLKKNTDILNITYKDKDREIILPVLNKMSKAFQIYSGKNKLRKIELTKKFLKRSNRNL